MLWFATASLLPVVLLSAGVAYGGIWPLVGLLAITVLVFFLDKLANRALPEDQDHDGHMLSLTLAAGHLAFLPLLVWGLVNGAHLDLLDKVILITGAGLWFGQVSNSNAHELIHRSDHASRRLGRVLYASLLNGHHATAHVRVHHVHASTDADPNSARVGEGFWTFMLRCARGEFIEGLRAENAARLRASKPMRIWSHPYVFDAIVSLGSLGFALSLGGLSGLLVLGIVAIYAMWQLMLSDYVQHYGLRRRILANGKPEPVGPRHSWNAPRWYSSAMMLNAPRHSDHHMHPGRPYPELRLDSETMPTLPQSLPVMAVIALVPPLWHRLMDTRAQRWRLEDEGPDGRRARDIPREVLDRARGTSTPRPNLPDWPHDIPKDSPARDRDQPVRQ